MEGVIGWLSRCLNMRYVLGGWRWVIRLGSFDDGSIFSVFWCLLSTKGGSNELGIK